MNRWKCSAVGPAWLNALLYLWEWEGNWKINNQPVRERVTASIYLEKIPGIATPN